MELCLYNFWLVLGYTQIDSRLALWLVNQLGKHSSQIWNLVPLCILWCIWKERNQRTFEDLVSPVIKCLLLLVELFLNGLRLEDSNPVILSLLFFAPFLFCSFSIVWFSIVFIHCYLFLVLSRLALCSSYVQSSLPYIYHSYLSKKN